MTGLKIEGERELAVMSILLMDGWCKAPSDGKKGSEGNATLFVDEFAREAVFL